MFARVRDLGVHGRLLRIRFCVATAAMLGASSLSAASAFAQAPVTITVNGSVTGRGSMTIQIDSYSKSIRYGEFSTAASLAAGFGGVLSLDASSPVWAKGFPDGTVQMKLRHGSAVGNVSINIVPDGSSGSSGGSGGSSGGSGSAPPIVVSTNPGAVQGGAPPSGTSVYSYTMAKADGSSGYDAAGNVIAYTDSVNAAWQAGYDGLNRLVSAVQNSSTTQIPTPWGSAMQQYLCWQYDSFGNRLQQASSSSPFSSIPNCSPSSSTSSTSSVTINSANQITNTNYTYDQSGNLTGDGISTYRYDGAGRVCAVLKNVTGQMTGYLYDADGNRVAKGTISPQTSNWCDLSTNRFTLISRDVLGPHGETLTEFDAAGNSRSEIMLSDGLAATLTANPNLAATIHFQLADFLGTRRVQTDTAGNTEESCLSGAFGDGLNCSGAETSPTHFTGKERDAESGLDYFGARYYGSNMGRMMSPDPGWFFSSHLANPQTWNQYAYVLNNPLKFTDPDGYDCVYLNNAGNGVESVDANSSQTECMGDGGKNKGTGGYWVDGTATQVTLFSNSNDVGLSGQVGGTQLGNGQATDAFYSSVYANSQQANIDSIDVNNTSLLSGYAYAGSLSLHNIRTSMDPYSSRLFGTHWCGPGGGGVPTNALDAACKAHDQCFDAAGISAANNAGGGSMTLQQAAAAQGCNAALGAAAAANPGLPGSTRISEWLKHGDQLLVITGGRIDGNLAAGTAIR